MAIHFKLLLVLALYTISASGDLLWSIDCGATLGGMDSNFITWQGDSEFFQNGTSSAQRVQSSNHISDVMDTLRVFNNAQKKNCYVLKLNTVGETRVLVRASFNYGNYDKKSSPPTFDLLFNGNFWTTVDTSTAIYHEVIYVVKRDHLSVCLVQTKPNQFPFISALEVRSLESNMYAKVDSTVALILQKRVAFGASLGIRDIYDRIWSPEHAGAGQVEVASDAIFVDVRFADQPPLSMLLNAIRTSRTSQPLILDMGFKSATTRAYINWYFSEVTALDATQTRSFEIFVNNQSISEPILPPYQSVNALSVGNFSVPSGAVISLVATSDSDLPPIINGMEVFIVRDVLTKGTIDDDDVEGSTTPSSNTPGYVTTRRSKKNKTGAIVGSTVPLFIVFWAIVGLIIAVRKRRTAAVAAATASDDNRPNGKPQGGVNLEMAGDVAGQAAANDQFTANVDPSSDQTSNQHHEQV